jgi:hypothetical protein
MHILRGNGFSLRKTKGKNKMRTKTAKKVKTVKVNTTVKGLETTLKSFMLNSQFKEVGEKMLAVMKTEMSNIIDNETRASYIAPREVEYSLVEKKLPSRFKNRRGAKGRIYIHKGEYYNLSELCNLFNLNYMMVHQRIKKGWNLLRVFGVENHRVDNYIKENMEEMKK